MKRKALIKLFTEIDREIFHPCGVFFPAAPIRFHRNYVDYWAAWDGTDYWIARALFSKEPLFIKEILAHERVHHWQTLCKIEDENEHHDRYFFGWSDKFFAAGLRLQKDYDCV
jgi:hypothetical protein